MKVCAPVRIYRSVQMQQLSTPHALVVARRLSHASASRTHTKSNGVVRHVRFCRPPCPARPQVARPAVSLSSTAPAGAAAWWGDPAAAAALHPPTPPPWRLGADLDPGLASLLAVMEGAWVGAGAVAVPLDEVCEERG